MKMSIAINLGSHIDPKDSLTLLPFAETSYSPRLHYVTLKFETNRSISLFDTRNMLVMNCRVGLGFTLLKAN